MPSFVYPQATEAPETPSAAIASVLEAWLESPQLRALEKIGRA